MDPLSFQMKRITAKSGLEALDMVGESSTTTPIVAQAMAEVPLVGVTSFIDDGGKFPDVEPMDCRTCGDQISTHTSQFLSFQNPKIETMLVQDPIVQPPRVQKIKENDHFVQHAYKKKRKNKENDSFWEELKKRSMRHKKVASLDGFDPLFSRPVRYFGSVCSKMARDELKRLRAEREELKFTLSQVKEACAMLEEENIILSSIVQRLKAKGKKCEGIVEQKKNFEDNLRDVVKEYDNEKLCQTPEETHVDEK